MNGGRRLLQVLANALFAATLYALVGVGFSLVYRAGRYFSFSYALVFATGGYATWVLNDLFSVPGIVASVGGIISGAGVGVALEGLLYERFRRRAASSLVLLLSL